MVRALEAQLATKRPLIERVARAFVRRQPRMELDDATQIVTLEVWKTLRDPKACHDDGMLAVRGYRRLIDEVRTGHVTGVKREGHGRGDRAALSLSAPAGEDHELGDYLADSDDAYAQLDERLAAAALAPTALAALSERERLTVYLRHWEGLREHEIGDILGVSPARISQILTRANLRMRHALRHAA